MPRILITPGEPAGIGPEITVKIAAEHWQAELITVCDPDLLPKSTLKNIPVKLKAPVIPGKLNPANAEYVLECLKIAANLCLNKNSTISGASARSFTRS